MARSTQADKARKPNDDEAIRLAMIRLAKQYGRYGYRKVAKLLRLEGWIVNHKKVERLWREEGLQLPKRHKKRKRLYHKDSSVIRLRPQYQNHIWSVDFVHGKLSSGRPSFPASEDDTVHRVCASCLCLPDTRQAGQICNTARYRTAGVADARQLPDPVLSLPRLG